MNGRNYERSGKEDVQLDYNSVFVCLMGMGTVFIGLTILILLTELMHRVCRKMKRAPAAQEVPQPQAETENREELLAAISAALAEEMGTDAAGIRIVSFKKV